MQLLPVLLLDVQVMPGVERLRLVPEPLEQLPSEVGHGMTADLLHHREHRILHRRVVGRAEVPDAPRQQDVDIPADKFELFAMTPVVSSMRIGASRS